MLGSPLPHPHEDRLVYTGLASYEVDARETIVTRHLPDGNFRHVLLKPNWVMHSPGEDVPIEALVTHPAVIEAVLRACCKRNPRAERMTIGDCPVQSCDWGRLSEQADIEALRRRWEHGGGPQIEFLDLRCERLSAEG